MHCQLFTLGHSAVQMDAFLELLAQHHAGILVDVCSSPRSMRFPHFDRIELETTLRSAGVRYLHLGEELGGRPADPKAYGADGLADYLFWRRSRAFQAGIERVLQEREHDNLVLMCAEEDPLECHRFLMICPELVARGELPEHIRKGGRIETQMEAEDRLLRENDSDAFAGPSLFSPDRDAALGITYCLQAAKYA